MNAISLSRWYINAGAIFLWKNMEFYIKVWIFPYYDVKNIFLWLILYLLWQLENREKPIDNISRGWYTENVQKIY